MQAASLPPLLTASDSNVRHDRQSSDSQATGIRDMYPEFAARIIAAAQDSRHLPSWCARPERPFADRQGIASAPRHPLGEHEETFIDRHASEARSHKKALARQGPSQHGSTLLAPVNPTIPHRSKKESGITIDASAATPRSKQDAGQTYSRASRSSHYFRINSRVSSLPSSSRIDSRSMLALSRLSMGPSTLVEIASASSVRSSAAMFGKATVRIRSASWGV